MKEKIITLLQSPILEDVVIGLIILLNNYRKEDIVQLFDVEGNVKAFDSPGYLSYRAFQRYDLNSTIDWKYYYRDEVGFYVGNRTMIVSNKKENMNRDYYNPIEL